MRTSTLPGQFAFRTAGRAHLATRRGVLPVAAHHASSKTPFMTYPLQLTAVDSTAYQHSILQSPQLRWPTTTFTRHASPRLEATTAAAELLDVHAWLEQRVKAALADVAESYGARCTRTCRALPT
eukprot:6189355-Pleurochrysis_carterae.AAC.1